MGFFPKKLDTTKLLYSQKENVKQRKIDTLIVNHKQDPLTINKSNTYVSKLEKKHETSEKPSFKGLTDSLRRLVGNKLLMYNNFSTVFCLIGAIPYWMFAPKYFEIQYLQSPSEASFKIGTISFIFSGFGVLLSGIIITKFKPRARYLASWNIFTSILGLLGLFTNYYMGCEPNDKSLSFSVKEHSNCNIASVCNCDFVRYSPVCGSNNQTYISACHAGCTDDHVDPQLNITVFTNCSCIDDANALAVQGACPIECGVPMMGFLIIIYLKKFLGASGLAGNFLVSLRCVEKRDKPLSVGLMLMMTSLLAFIPAPIYFGINMDKACLVWGKTCTSNGNCWFYDGPKMRFAMNIVGAYFVTVGTVLDVGVWYYAKNIKIFDEENTNEIEEYNNKNTNAG